MAETDILNPYPGFWDELGDSPTWNYDWSRKKAINKQEIQPRLGTPYSRDISNAGHSFAWNWNNRPLATMQRLLKFYEQFKHGYFTVIDYDGGGRHYVGRFIAPPYPQQVGNLTYTAQAVQFQEVPRARMLQYPSDWENSGFFIYAVDDFLRPLVATSPVYGVWNAQQTPQAIAAGVSVNTPSSYEMLWFGAAGQNAGFAQALYVGWGFRMRFRLGTAMGRLDLYLDDVLIVQQLDLYDGSCTAHGPAGGLPVNNPPVQIEVNGAAGNGSVLVTVAKVPLDMHRVKVAAYGTKSPLSAGYAVIYPPLEGIY